MIVVVSIVMFCIFLISTLKKSPVKMCKILWYFSAGVNGLCVRPCGWKLNLIDRLATMPQQLTCLHIC